ncbi:asparagine synthase-related protein [Luteimonas sp. TWI1437]|uniref:asparagine synthase-related protein n=1 Tax=unclassified Luteimonas TaxID=2629088 RepID=UPI003208F709
MRYRYLGLIGDPAAADALTPKLAAIGLKKRLDVGAAALLVSDDTPVLHVPAGGLLLGRLFDGSGARVENLRRLATGIEQDALPTWLARHCWGEYLLVLRAADGGVSLTRDPAPACSFPCIYVPRQQGAIFASDIALMRDVPLQAGGIDWETITRCLAYPQAKMDRTGIEGLRELLPGSTLHVGATCRITQTWSPWTFTEANQRHTDPREAAADVRSAVTRAVMAAASDAGTLLLELSGGLDSSVVGICLKERSDPLVCSTLRAPTPGADEQHYAAQIADRLGAPLHIAELRLDAAHHHFPLPVRTPLPRVGALQQIIDATVQTVADQLGTDTFLTGGGGDAVFAYLKSAAPAADAFRSRGMACGTAAIRDLATLHGCTRWKAGKLTLAKLFKRPRDLLAPDTRFLASHAVLPPPAPHPWLDGADDALPGDRERVFALTVTQMFRDSAPRAKVRHMEMPLLSQPVVEACLRVPSWMWVAGGRNRAIARDAFADVLPEDIVRRRSKGSFMSYIGMVYDRNRRDMRAFLLDGKLHAQGLLDTVELRRVLDDDRPLRDRGFIRLFDLCTAENWARQQG